MASLNKVGVLAKYKCKFCNQIPCENEVLQCANNHLICFKCIIQGKKCSCDDSFKMATNPLVKAISMLSISSAKETCPFEGEGCNWAFSENNSFESHIMECKYRPYKCIGDTLNVWSCSWSGPQHIIGNHFKAEHKSDIFNYFDHGSVDFQSTKTNQYINLIDAFNKKFVFYYRSDVDSANVLFIIFLLGRKCDAKKYLIDFELKKEHRKLKFVEECFSDADSLDDLMKDERCFVITAKLFQSYATGEKVKFRFVIKRKDVVEEEEKMQERYSMNKGFGNNMANAGRTVGSPQVTTAKYAEAINRITDVKKAEKKTNGSVGSSGRDKRKAEKDARQPRK